MEQARIRTPLGEMQATARADALLRLAFLDEDAAGADGPLTDGIRPAGGILGQVQAELDAYFAGDLREFGVPVDPAGTPFQRRVWETLRGIPYGMTRSYGEHAGLTGSSAAVRAVARANGHNPIAIIIPCHRVLGASGRLTGYRGGLWRKERLLDLERGGRLDL
jgi:methylated-DNA-[protein]-cysteine S-methyltransferase